MHYNHHNHHLSGQCHHHHLLSLNGNPLQCSCLENLRDGGAWWAAVHGVAKSQTRLSDFAFPCAHRALHLSLHFSLQSSQSVHVTMPISQVRNLKLREVNDLPKFTEMVTEQRWDLTQGILPKYTKRCLSCIVTQT